LRFSFKGFSYLGIWAAKEADFICIEPWCGIADSVDSTQVLTEKEGIEYLDTGGVFERTWMVTTS
jgi:galactose mutarotase-like enzyme